MRVDICTSAVFERFSVLVATPSKTDTPERDHFLNALAEVNIPETLVKNKNALERYRLIKTDTSRVAEKEENYEKDINFVNASSPLAQKVEKPVRKKKKQGGHMNIVWDAPL